MSGIATAYLYGMATHMRRFYGLLLIAFMPMFMACAQSSGGEPWQPNQLMPPAQLASSIQLGKQVPLIISIGPGAIIKGSVDIGPGGDAVNIAKLKTLLQQQDKSKPVVIYCGCCPFRNCPNIRPAFALLNSMGFTKHQLLNLSTNIKVDWIDKGFPVQ